LTCGPQNRKLGKKKAKKKAEANVVGGGKLTWLGKKRISNCANGKPRVKDAKIEGQKWDTNKNVWKDHKNGPGEAAMQGAEPPKKKKKTRTNPSVRKKA